MYFRIIILFALLFSFNLSYGQTVSPYGTEEEDKEEEKPRVSVPKKFDIDLDAQQKTPQKVLPPQQYLEQALEGEIDSTRYILGPGDLLLVNVWGPMSNQIMSEITAEGYLVIPGISDIKVAGLTLANGSERIKEVMGKYFKNTDFTVRLLKMRKFRVYIVGEIRNPGTYFIRGSDRLGDLIDLANGLSGGADETRIEIRHASGDVDTVDYSLFYRNGIKVSNPYLQGGDVVYIPVVDLSSDYVMITGNPQTRGFYRIKQGENLLAILYRLQALTRESNIRDVVIVRDGQYLHFNLMNDIEAAENEKLVRGDRIYIPAVQEYVYVQGEANQPGAYPYVANFRAKDYAGMGGLRETSKGIEDLYVIHSQTGEIEEGGDAVVEEGDIVVVRQKRREQFKDILGILTPILSITLSTLAIIQASK